jgi:choline dehydrogenase
LVDVRGTTAEAEFDFVIVGGGPAGCILANRLSAHPSTRVLLLEAGPPDYWWDLRLKLPLAMGFPVGNPRYDWLYESGAEPGLGSRKLHHPRGKVLGGSSSINGMIYERGSRGDYDRWGVEAGSDSWSFANCLPYFQRLEGCIDEPLGTTRGRTGPQTLHRGPAEGPIFEAFFKAAEQAGYPVVPDFNDDVEEGFSPLDQAVRAGKRASAAQAYLHPVQARDNLTVRCHAQATQVVFEGTRAVGVRYRGRDGAEQEVRAAEVILSGGAVGTPQLLQLSGVGDKDHLDTIGIPLVHHLPGVGESLQDHLAVHVQHKCAQPVSLSPIRNKARWPGVVLEGLLFQRGPATRNPMQAGGFVKSDHSEGEPDLMFLLAPLAMHSAEDSVEVSAHGYQMHVGVMQSDARGCVKIVSRDPREHPEIVINFLSGSKDEVRWVEAIRRARALLGQQAFRHLDAGETLPGPGVDTDEEIIEWVRANGRTGYHLACSARMGRDEGAVVDPDSMRVHGLDGLRVVDASVMPSLTNANTLAPTMMIAEKAADMILGNTPPAPAEVARRGAPAGNGRGGNGSADVAHLDHTRTGSTAEQG